MSDLKNNTSATFCLKDACTTAAFFMEGLHTVKAGYEEIIRAYREGGCIELVSELSRYAELSEIFIEALNSGTEGFPGVYDYEVSIYFGAWFGEYILEHGQTPPTQIAGDKLRNMILEFFLQGGIDSSSLDIALKHAMEIWIGSSESIN